MTTTVILKHNDKWGYFWQRGNETFYDEQRRWIVFESPEEARDWLANNHPEFSEIEGKAWADHAITGTFLDVDADQKQGKLF